MLTYEKFKEIAPGITFLKGILPDDPTGLHMTGSGKMLKWVAVKGWINDWCIYTYWADNDFSFIESNGDKVLDEENIRRTVPCDDSTLGRYRT